MGGGKQIFMQGGEYCYPIVEQFFTAQTMIVNKLMFRYNMDHMI